MTNRKLLALCDSPTINSGFACVAKNLLSRWHESAFFDEIWVWAIGHHGYPSELPYRLVPAAPSCKEPIWWQPGNLQRFLNQANRNQPDFAPYTHVWMMHDPQVLLPLAEPLLKMRNNEAAPMTSLYFPVDGRMLPEWTRVIEAVDRPVAYTEWGAGEVLSAFSQKMEAAKVVGKARANAVTKLDHRLGRLPHGVDTSTYYPMEQAARLTARAERFDGLVAPDDLLLVNVNTHQKRKGLFQTLETFAHLIHCDVDEPRAKRWKLYMHMPQANPDEGTDLAVMARHLAIPADRILYGDNYFHGSLPSQSEATLNEIYNSADLIINTTHGEGWGLTVTEAMAAGCVVAAPRITSLNDFFDDVVGIPLPTYGSMVLPGDHSQPRPMVDARGAADEIMIAFDDSQRLDSIRHEARTAMLAERYDWDVIAAQWLDIFANDRSDL